MLEFRFGFGDCLPRRLRKFGHDIADVNVRAELLSANVLPLRSKSWNAGHLLVARARVGGKLAMSSS